MSAEVKLLVLAHAAATLMMAGAIWMVQLVHYPLFRFVGADAFVRYEMEHIGAITLVVLPLMGIEALTGLILLGAIGSPELGLPGWLIGTGFALIVLVWLITAIVNVPQHNLLAGGFDAAVHNALVTSNWIRTLAWTARAGIVVWMIGGLMR